MATLHVLTVRAEDGSGGPVAISEDVERLKQRSRVHAGNEHIPEWILYKGELRTNTLIEPGNTFFYTITTDVPIL